MSIRPDIPASDPRCLLRRSFTDMESVAEALGWAQGFCQLETGELEAEVDIVGHEACRVVRITFNHSFHQRARPPDGFKWFGLPDLSVDALRIGGIDVAPAPLVNFSYEGGLDVTSSGQFCGTMLAFRLDLVSEVADIDGLDPAFAAHIARRRYWAANNLDATVLRELLTTVFVARADSDYGDWLREHRDLFDFELAAATLRMICAQDQPVTESPSSRRRTVERALNAMEQCDTLEMTVAELCRASSASMSTLNRAFQEEFGVSPKTYMRARRLAAVQKLLINADGDTRVADVANAWGFWHMGSFAADYRKQFGELPSETLARPG